MGLLSGGSRRECIPLPSPASGGSPCSLAQGPTSLWLLLPSWHLLPWPDSPASSYKDLCDYIGPNQKIQEDFLIKRFLTLSCLQSPFCHIMSHSHILVMISILLSFKKFHIIGIIWYIAFHTGFFHLVMCIYISSMSFHYLIRMCKALDDKYSDYHAGP